MAVSGLLLDSLRDQVHHPNRQQDKQTHHNQQPTPRIHHPIHQLTKSPLSFPLTPRISHRFCHLHTTATQTVSHPHPRKITSARNPYSSTYPTTSVTT